MRIQIDNKTAWLNFHHLYYFSVIAIEGSISKASEKLKIGQPTLSAQLKQFENALGTPLFDRQHKKLNLNETGKIVQNYAGEIFRLGSEMVEVIHDRLPTKRFHVQIGALDSVPKRLILEISKAAMAMQDCVVTILEGKSDELLRELANHKIDLIVSNFVPTSAERSGLYSRSIAKVPVIICGSAKFKHLKKDFPQSLNQAPFVVPTRHSKLRHDLDHYFRTSDIHVDVIAETQDTAIQSLMGVAGLGLIPMPLPGAIDLIKNKNLYEIGRLSGVSEELFFISASRKIANPVSSALMKSFHIQ